MKINFGPDENTEWISSANKDITDKMLARDETQTY